MPLYVVMVEDGNGKGAAVAYALLANERKESIFFFLNTLLKTNPLVKDLATCFIVDKDFTQINVIESLFSKAQVILCRFHVHKLTSSRSQMINEAQSDQFSNHLCIPRLDTSTKRALKNWKRLPPRALSNTLLTTGTIVDECGQGI